MDKPQAVAFFLADEIDPADPLAAVKWRARDLDGAAAVLKETARTGTVAARAEAIDQAASLFGDSAFDPADTYDACEAWGLPGGAVDAAAHVAVTLREIELGHGG